MPDKLYRVLELQTSGWEQVDDNSTNLTKQQCDALLEKYMNDGISPDRLKVQRVA